MKIIKEASVAWNPALVVLVSSFDSENNRGNIITIAWTGTICSKPPQISVSMRPATHSHGLVKKTKDFVVNIPTLDQYDISKKIGRVTGRKVNKFEEYNLTGIKGNHVSAPMIEECPINIECKVVKEFELGTHTMFIGEVIEIHVDEFLEHSLSIKPLVYSPKGGIFGYSNAIKK